MDGIINVLKPPGMTSNDVVVDIRRLLKIKRVGHTGTLDPGAAGVLPVCLGRATRLFDQLVDKNKTYIAEITFGISTDTQDSYGRVVASCECDVNQTQILEVLGGFIGEQMQRVPGYSAVKVNGRKMYELARQAKDMPEKSRRITIFDIVLIEQTAKNKFLLRIDCSKGTYVRTLCADIGARLGVCAHMSFLLRTAAGEYTLESSCSIKEIERFIESGTLEAHITPIDQAIAFMPEIHIDETQSVKLRNGNAVGAETVVGNARENVCSRIYCGGFVGIGTLTDGQVRINTLLCDPIRNGGEEA
jgi:tRNA pseudouridine55 synthase